MFIALTKYHEYSHAVDQVPLRGKSGPEVALRGRQLLYTEAALNY